MHKKVGALRIAVILLVFALLVSGCSSGSAPTASKDTGKQAQQPAEPAQTSQPKNLRMGTSSVGGVYYVLGAAWGKLLEENIPGVKVQVEATSGPGANVQLMEQDKLELALVSTIFTYQGMRGEGFAEGKKHEKFRAMFPIFSSPTIILTSADSPIKSLKDMQGKTVCVGPVAAGGAQFGKDAMELFNIKPRQVVNLSWADSMQALAEGRVDVAICQFGHPNASVLELENTRKIRFVPLSEQEIDQLVKKYPYYSKQYVPKGTYKYLTEDYATVGPFTYSVCHKDLSDDLVYKIVSLSFEKKAALVAAAKAAEEMKPEDVSRIDAPLHPGAARYYAEKGIKK
ncbi:MAG: TAXI family TRAP transporter solute-binding subunit [Bacillota bacterium]